ncbi:MAG: elongation factor Ts [Bacteroidia bacterium]|nr:elongation factor Ts [Bacteroidia bacterium]
MSTLTITAADVNRLRTQTGAGMMDCKKALTEANGDFEAAVDYLRKKGQKVAANRGDRDAKEGYAIAKIAADGKSGVIFSLNCETDFVAINADFIKFAESIADSAVAHKFNDTAALLASDLNGAKIADLILDNVAKIGEKIEVGQYSTVTSEKVVAYNHPGNRIATIVSFNKNVDDQVGKDVAMQIAAMCPIALDKDSVDTTTIEREMEIAKDQVRAEGKPEDMVEKIAQGKLAKFFKENTLNNQEFIKDSKLTVAQYVAKATDGAVITGFKRVALS